MIVTTHVWCIHQHAHHTHSTHEHKLLPPLARTGTSRLLPTLTLHTNINFSPKFMNTVSLAVAWQPGTLGFNRAVKFFAYKIEGPFAGNLKMEMEIQGNRKMVDRKKKDGKKTGAGAAEWPVLKAKSDLRITRLKDDDLFTVHNFLTSAESKAYIKFSESLGFVHQGSLGPTMGEAYRDNDRVSVLDQGLADAIWTSGLDKLLSHLKIRGKVAVGLNPNIRFYRYKTGQRFGRHIDESNDLGNGKRTRYTLLIYLSGGMESTLKNDKNLPDLLSELLVGGETVFYGPRNSLVAEVPPVEGMALLHIHGDKCMLHEARNVNKGVKYVLRSDVVFA